MIERPATCPRTRPSAGEVWQLAVAWGALAVARVMVGLLPLAVVRRFLGERSSTEDVAPELTHAESRRARRVAVAIRRAVRRSPWRSDCYPQALAARLQLRSLGVAHTVCFGVRRSEEGLVRAHAWVRAGDVVVTGGDGRGYTTVASFCWAPDRSR